MGLNKDRIAGRCPLRVLVFLVVAIAALGALSAFLVMPHDFSRFDRQKVIDAPFTTGIRWVKTGNKRTPDGRYQIHYSAEADRRSYCAHGAAIIDIGDTRIAIPGLRHSGVGTGSVTIDATRPSSGRSGGGGGGGDFAFYSYHEGDVTECTIEGRKDFALQFTIEKAVMKIGGETVPIGSGHRVVFIDEFGEASEIVVIDEETTIPPAPVEFQDEPNVDFGGKR